MRPIARVSQVGLIVAGLLARSVPLRAQAVLESPQGRIEIIGLRQWTIRMLEDSMAAKAPGESLQSHACAAVLQQKLGFPAAAVNIEMSASAVGAGPKRSVLITLVEPRDSAVVQFRRLVGERRLPRGYWSAFKAVAQDSSGLRLNDLLFAMQLYGQYRAAPDSATSILTQFAPSVLPFALGFWDEAAHLTDAKDFDVALRTARSDTSWQNRVIAVSVLANFAAQDKAWHALASALRDPEERVRSAAAAVLQGLVRRPVRRVDWRPARSDLRALVGGTNVWDYRTLLQVLSKTAIDPQLGRPLLRGNTAMLLAHLRAESVRANEPALALVKRLSGQPGLSRDAAIAWTSSL